MAAIKIVANTVAVTTDHAQITDSRIQRIYNSNTTDVENVEFGANSTAVTKMITVGPGATARGGWQCLAALLLSLSRTGAL